MRNSPKHAYREHRELGIHCDTDCSSRFYIGLAISLVEWLIGVNSSLFLYPAGSFKVVNAGSLPSGMTGFERERTRW